LQLGDEGIGSGGAEPLDGGQWRSTTSFERISDRACGSQRPPGAPGAKRVRPDHDGDGLPVPGDRHLLTGKDPIEQFGQRCSGVR